MNEKIERQIRELAGIVERLASECVEMQKQIIALQAAVRSMGQ